MLRLATILYADARAARICRVEFAAARALFNQAIDLVIHVGWRGGQRRALGVWEVVEGDFGFEERGDVRFRKLWAPGDEIMQPATRERG